jgi:CRP/FNR family transcriptional regulator, dissimilatory nitrate respiration regulator
MLMPKQERATAAALKRAAIFRTLPPSAATHLAAGATQLNSPRGSQLFQRGKRGAGLYLVMSGRLMLSVGAGSERKVVELIGPGGHVGLAASLLGAPETATADVLSDSTLLFIPRDVLLDNAAENTALGLHLATALGRHVFALTSDIEAFALHSGRKRVADFLLDLVTANDDPQRPLTLPAKKSIIASRLNLTPEYFSRMLHDLIADGTLAVNGRQVSILDPAHLRQIS